MGILNDVEKIRQLKDQFEIEADQAETLADRVAASVGFARLTKELAEIRETPGYKKAVETAAMNAAIYARRAHLQSLNPETRTPKDIEKRARLGRLQRQLAHSLQTGGPAKRMPS